jgi:hypothetical protein
VVAKGNTHETVRYPEAKIFEMQVSANNLSLEDRNRDFGFYSGTEPQSLFDIFLRDGPAKKFELLV